MKHLRKTKVLLSVLLGFTLPMSAFAKDDCTDAKDIVDLVENFYAPKPELINKISPELRLSLQGLDGYADPTGLLYRFGETQVKLELDKDGRVLGLEKALDFNKDGELCKLVDGKIPLDDGESSAQANMNFRFIYSDKDGSHDMADIYEGAKDGSKIMKSLAPGGLGFVVPGLKTLMLKPAQEKGTVPNIRFLMKGTDVPMPKFASIGTTRLFKLKDIKRSRADTILIDGPYELEATFKFDDEDIAKAQAELEAETTE